MHIDFGLGISLDVATPLGVSFSGGVDSAMVVYHILKQYQGPVVLYTVTVRERDYNHAHIMLPLIKWFQSQFNNTLYLDLSVELTKIQGGVNLFARPQQDLELGRINSFFTGLTANPPDDEHQTFRYRHLAHSPRLRSPNLERTVQRYPGWYEPYTNVNKKDLAKLYRAYDLMDTLFPLTRSCCETRLDHCGQCWCCEERLWAFGRLI